MSEFTEGTILTPDGTPATIPTVTLDKEDAELLRKYRKFLERYGLREALYCQHCWEEYGQGSSGCEAFVTTNKILIRCRHRLAYFQGLTY